MHKAPDLTVNEIYVARKIKCLVNVEMDYSGMSLGNAPLRKETRKSAAEVRSFIKRRKANPKYAGCLQAYERMKRAIERNDFEDLQSAHYEMNAALKYQGYLQMIVVVAEKAIEDKTDDEVEQMMLLEAL